MEEEIADEKSIISDSVGNKPLRITLTVEMEQSIL